jgi:Sulfotransferase family
MTDPTVVFLGGAGRSGSTLLERMLGQLPGVVAVGEVVHLLQRGLLDDDDCGCGCPFSECPFWTKVGDRAFSGWPSGPDARRWAADQLSVDRNRQVPSLVAGGSASFRDALARHGERLASLYRSIAEVSGAHVIVDSSKHVSTALVLRRTSGVDLHVVHLVRDSRGVAHSWTKEVARPETRAAATMPRYHPASAAGWWDWFNLGFAGVRRLGVPTTTLRYEDLLADPRGTIATIAGEVGVRADDEALAFLRDDEVQLEADHSVAGNPMRFETGTLHLRRDDAWRRQLADKDRRVVTALTAPLLARYGYLGRRAS